MTSSSIHPIIPEKDAADIAQLVKSCFRPWLDLENIEYLGKLREEGLYACRHPLLSKLSSFPYKLEGVVCRDPGGELLGLINSYDCILNDRPCCLLANICVDPSRRKEGIASRMLTRIEEILRAKGKRGLFLQARVEKPDVIDFYRKRGFRVTDYRETWVRPRRRKDDEKKTAAFRQERVPRSDQEMVKEGMKKNYPLSVLWNLDYSRELFRPGAAAEIMNRITSPSDRFRRVTDREGKVLAWAAYQKRTGSADTLWLIPAAGTSEAEYASVLKYLGTEFTREKAVRVDTAAGRDPEIFRSAGFTHMHTLAWMWKKL